MPNVSTTELQRFARQILLANGVPAEAAELTAASLVAANASGVDSHGVQLLPLYVDQLASGDVNAKSSGQVTGEFGSCLLFDGENGLGQVVAARCCAEAVELARRFTIGLVVARNSNHFGRAAYWGSRISSADCLGIVLSNSSPLVAPWQGREARLGTNPICVAAPGPWLLDMATTSVAAGRIVDAVLDGDSAIPEEWALDAAGNPTTNASAALKGTVLPLGGRVAGYKGSGLAVAVEILCGVLSGGPIGKEVGSLRARGRPAGISQTFLAIDFRRFLPVGEFEARIGRLVGMVKSTPPAPGFDEVLVAGEKEARCAALRLREGTPIPNRLWRTLGHLAEKYKVETLQPLSAQVAAD
ncbi:MAG: Ldh family oxidoreductase [Candidatus Solibacter sp.]|jgi:LDH2 family malate/lactate/ureidoglycolate dehydrogenase